MESNKFRISDEQETTKVYLHNEQDHIEWDTPEKVEVQYEDVNELNVCKICQRRFCSEEELNNHLLQPRLTKNYDCCACGKAHINSSNLNVHLRKHTGDRPYVCVVCSKKFKRNDHLKLHMNTHTREKPYECFDCDRKFAYLGSLSKHVAVHANDRQLSCSICNKQFKRKESLTSHRKIHFNQENKEKSPKSKSTILGFKCDTCLKVYLSRRDLKHHQIRAHKGPFVCEICEVKFTREDNRNYHMKMHTMDGKLFSCDACKTTFRWQRNLKRHINKVCGRSSQKCEKINKKLEPFSILEVKMEQEEHHVIEDARNPEQNGQIITDYKDNIDFIKIEPEEPQIVEVKIEQEEHYVIGDTRKLEPNGQTVTGHKENHDFIKVESEEP